MSDHNILQKAKEHDDSILGKAVFKALEQGWDGGGLKLDAPVSEIIYNHDFCRALWGTDEQEGQHLAETENYYAFEAAENVTYEGPVWKLHLMNMVISDDPLAYLGEHL